MRVILKAKGLSLSKHISIEGIPLKISSKGKAVSQEVQKYTKRISTWNRRNLNFFLLQGNNYFKRRLPPDTEAANVFVGHLQFIEMPICIFIRLNNSSIMGDLCEVGTTTKKLFQKNKNLGRSWLMNNFLKTVNAFKSRRALKTTR